MTHHTAGSHRWLLVLLGAAALLSLGACNRNNTPQVASTTAPDPNINPVEAASIATDQSNRNTSVASTQPYGASAPMAAGSDQGSLPGAMTEAQPTGAGINSSTAQVGAPEIQFITEAAAGGLFEVRVAQLAAQKANDTTVKSYASMLLEDHTAANEKLRQLAAGLRVSLPTDISEDNKKVLERLGQASGNDFDRQFVETVGIKDHKDDIAKFEKVGNTTANASVRTFALATLPTLRAHLRAAQKLPVKG